MTTDHTKECECSLCLRIDNLLNLIRLLVHECRMHDQEYHHQTSETVLELACKEIQK